MYNLVEKEKKRWKQRNFWQYITPKLRRYEYDQIIGGYVRATHTHTDNNGSTSQSGKKREMLPTPNVCLLLPTFQQIHLFAWKNINTQVIIIIIIIIMYYNKVLWRNFTHIPHVNILHSTVI